MNDIEEEAKCKNCNGTGESRYAYYTGGGPPIDDPCPECLGSGVQPGYYPRDTEKDAPGWVYLLMGSVMMIVGFVGLKETLYNFDDSTGNIIFMVFGIVLFAKPFIEKYFLKKKN